MITPDVLNQSGLLLLVLWDLVWKGIGLWSAGQNNQKYWFIAILLFNTAGILPIIYLKFFQKQYPASEKWAFDDLQTKLLKLFRSPGK